MQGPFRRILPGSLQNLLARILTDVGEEDLYIVRASLARSSNKGPHSSYISLPSSQRMSENQPQGVCESKTYQNLPCATTGAIRHAQSAKKVAREYIRLSEKLLMNIENVKTDVLPKSWALFFAKPVRATKMSPQHRECRTCHTGASCPKTKG